MPIIRIDGKRITDRHTFHDVFIEAFGFPDFYGRNMDAWIDCMQDFDDPEIGMTKIHGSANDIVVLQIDNADDLPEEIFDALVECAGFVNWSRIEQGAPAILALSFHRAAR